MKKSIILSALIIWAMISCIFAGNVSAMPGGSWASGIKIQNLEAEGVPDGSLILLLYSASGGDPAYTIQNTAGGSPLTVASGKSVEVYMPSFSSVGAGEYSLVINSSVRVSAVVTTTNYTYGMADSYNGMDPDTKVFIPNVYHNHNNWSTEIFIQNTSETTTAEVSVHFVEPSSSAAAGDGLGDLTKTYSIPARGSQAIDTTDSAFDGLNWFIGGATISSTNNIPLAVVANQVRLVGTGDIAGNVMISSPGLPETFASTKILLPSLYNNFVGASGTWRSGIKIANPSASTTANVTVAFSSDPGTTTFSGSRTLSITAGNSAELYLPNTTLTSPADALMPSQFKGYAVVESNIPVVAVVQHTNYTGASGYGVAIGYAGFGSGSSKISLPSLYNWQSGAGVWISGIKIQNFSSVNNATFDVTFNPDPDSISKVTGSKTGITLEPGKATELYFGGLSLDGGATLPVGWKGSAVIKGTGGTEQLVATVIHTNYGRHVANMYTGVPFP